MEICDVIARPPLARFLTSLLSAAPKQSENIDAIYLSYAYQL
jgi:hypothetical protein